MDYKNIEQGTDAWKAIRLGKVTASRVKDILAKTKTGVSASRANYLSDLVVERRTGMPANDFKNEYMQWGTETEPKAREAYELATGELVTEIAFVDHPEIPMAGASPDGLVGTDGLIEIKCPSTKTHIETLMDDKVPNQYIPQMQWQMACTGRKWCDFVSFDPRLPDGEQFFCKRVYRNDEYINTLESEVQRFLNEVNEAMTKLDQRTKK